MKTIISILAFILIILNIKAQNNNNVSASKEEVLINLKTNEDYIRNINNKIDLNNTLNVFEVVFNSLKSEITVFPTENYYYYQFETSGKTIKGNIALFANKRDEGIINFAFEEITNLPGDDISIYEGVAELDKTKGVNVQKINDFEYDVTFKYKTVRFFLNKLNISFPKTLTLRPDEIFIGPTEDESGIKFYLIYNNKFKSFFWVLNEESYITESFLYVVENVLIGKRTEFVFFDDKVMNRKILFGVKKDNVKLNNWFDGPFDQLPDNYIKTGDIELQKFIEEAYPFYNGKIDKYGHFLDEVGSRVALSTYLTYNSYIEVLKVYYACKNSSKDEEEFIYNLTRERLFETNEE